jgi:PAS domain S-box-containing protein
LATDSDGQIVLANSRIDDMFGYERQELLGQKVERLVPEAIHQRHVEDRRGYTRSPFRREMKEGRLLFAVKKNGTEFPVQISLGPVATPAGALVVCFVRDMTRMQQIEKRLAQIQKMEAVGNLAGGIAHDFNNLLTIINGHAEALFRSLGADFRACQRVQEVAKAGDRAAQLTRQLLAFSRQQILRPRVLNLNDLVADFQRMLGRLIGEDITLATKLSPDLRQVKADPGQIEQVLMNLAVNARDAMPKGGCLTIETANAELDESYARTHPDAKPGHYAVLAVSDTGCGMDKETMARIFEPFFTTKGPSKGTGLGLATVYGIVKQSGGYIHVYSEPGHGTTFKVYLPLTGEEASAVESKPSAPAPTGKETVLLVEDEDGVRALLRSTLEEHGYAVLEAAHGKEALAVAQSFARPIDLLLTDVVMPEMGGRVLAERFAVLYPQAKAIFMSGYTDDMVVRQGVLEAEVEFIQKPYTMSALLWKIREVLDQDKAGNGKPQT